MKRLLFSLPLFVLAIPVQAQTANDPRWAPWLGCWELFDDDIRDATVPADPPAADQPQSAGAPRPRVCATPVPPNGAAFVTTVGDQKALEQSVFANGVEHPVEDGECRGTQRAEWSRDGLRLYARARLTCAGDTAARQVTGLALLAPDGTWLDVQAVEVGRRENVRVRRYRRVVDEASEAAAAKPRLAATSLTLDDVKEASSKISPRALEAALVETHAGFDLTGKDLIDLDDAGVAGRVVDVLVALSYPERFIVERTRDRSHGGALLLNDPFFLDYGFFSPLYGSFYAPYYYSPFAYSYYGRYYDPSFWGPTFIVVGGDSSGPRPSGTGRVVDGLGYTRIRERTSGNAGGIVSTGSSERASSGSSSSGSSGSSSSDGGSVSSQGFSSGSSGGDTGRTAVPR